MRQEPVLIDSAYSLALSDIPTGAETFWRFFMRFEYALKQCGFLQKKDDAQADWDAFAKIIDKNFFADVILKLGRVELIEYPPNKQIRISTPNQVPYLSWKPQKPARNNKELFIALRRVRNNLFHGGKLGIGNTDRAGRLISESIIILKMALAAHEGVRNAFSM